MNSAGLALKCGGLSFFSFFFWIFSWKIKAAKRRDEKRCDLSLNWRKQSVQFELMPYQFLLNIELLLLLLVPTLFFFQSNCLFWFSFYTIIIEGLLNLKKKKNYLLLNSCCRWNSYGCWGSSWFVLMMWSPSNSSSKVLVMSLCNIEKKKKKREKKVNN